MNRKILRIAIPSIISNITVPLLSLVDIAIVGHLGSQTYIGAIAVGSLIFNIIYWLFGFLRMGTSGITSQAFGGRELKETSRVLYRVTVFAVLVAFVLIIAQYPIKLVAKWIVMPSLEVWSEASLYFDICVWGAPAVLVSYAFAGWFVGMQNSRFPMIIAIVQNIVNIVVSLTLVELCGMKVAGVAIGTLVAQYVGIALALLLWNKYYRKKLGQPFSFEILKDRGAINRLFVVNRAIFLRTLCLIAVTTCFTTFGARSGDTILAINTLLMQFFTIFSYVMDGFAYSGEALVGRYVGANNKPLLDSAIKNLFRWGWGLALLFCFAYIFGGDALLALLTDDVSVASAAREYMSWVALIPLAGFAAFLWDGIMIGATRTDFMMFSMIIASVLFFGLLWWLQKRFGNDALWLAFDSYLLARGVAEWVMWKKSYCLG